MMNLTTIGVIRMRTIYDRIMYFSLMYIYKGNTKKELEIICKYDPLNLLKPKNED
tara:strand:+ start:87 stop:251 length:165 start_codon:yes stop_codon:yes gene_type:complete